MNTSHLPFARSYPNVGFAGLGPLARLGSHSWRILTVLCGLAGMVSAEQFGDFTYDVIGGSTVTITSYSNTATGFPVPGTGVVNIPATIDDKPVTAVGDYAFQACTLLTNVTIPTSVTGTGIYVFKNCTGLAFITLPSGLTAISEGVFSGCGGLESIVIPAGVTSIGTNAFSGCKLLSGISLPDGLTSIQFGAFSNCGGLTSLTIPSGVTVIPGGMLASCSGLTSVVIQGAVTNIGSNAFQYCSKLKSFTIPATVTTIGKSAFAECLGLTSINIPASVTTIGIISAPNVFIVATGSSLLTAITVDAANPYFSSSGGLLLNKGQTTLITCPGGLSGALVLPSSVTAISTLAFSNCGKLTGVTFPSGLTGIGSKAFFNCGTLSAANFTGNAPTTMSSDAFSPAPNNFAVYYPSTATGFTSPTWFGYPAFGISGDPVVAWLTTYQLPADSDLKSDLNGDGVSLLMAYALNLNPNQNLSGALPQPVLTTDQMRLSFYAGAAGVAYVVESSTDLQVWSAGGVSVSAPDANQIRTATVGNAASSRFVRLVVSR